MKVKTLLAVGVLALASTLTGYADPTYRTHRYDSFRATPVNSNDAGPIVFLGNSITNMHNWNEAFPDQKAKIINRGNSGGFAAEWVEEIESITDMNPSKVFIGIGTNDCNWTYTTDEIIQNIQLLVHRIKLACPSTDVYLQTILPRTASAPMAKISVVNTAIKANGETWGATKVIDLDETMANLGKATSTGFTGSAVTSWSPDGLHPTGLGYRAWCQKLVDEGVGLTTCAYSTGNYHSSIESVSNPSRITQFSLLPMAADDIMFLGDEMVENGEWNELMGVSNIKKRSNGYGFGGLSLADAKAFVTVSLETDKKTTATDGTVSGTQEAPGTILVYWGTAELSSGTTADAFSTKYQELITHIESKAPNAKIYAISVLPMGTTAKQTLATSYNEKIAAIAESDSKVTYVNIYTPVFTNAGTVSSTYGETTMKSDYVTGHGYVVAANTIATALGITTATTLADADAVYDKRTARKSLGILYNQVWKILNNSSLLGDGFGQYNSAAQTKLEAAKEKIAAILDDHDAVTADQLTECTTAVEEAVGSFNGPDLSDATTDHWYTLKSARGSKYATAASGTLTGVAGAFSVSYGDNVWKFVKRSDETLDIINANGLYITPNSTSTAAITLSESSPATGWEISYSTHTTGNVTIGSVINSTTNCQLNQSTGTNVLNWHNGYPNRTDEGCSYTLAAYDGLILDPSEKLTSGWYELQCASYTNTKTVEDAYSCKNYVGQYIINGDSELEQTTATPYNYYPLQYSTTQPTNAPKAWVYITVDGSTYKFTSSNGHGVQENCTASYESLPTSNPTVAAVSKDDNGIQYTISHWSQFGGYVGAASATLNTFYIRPVDTTGYDEWTVTIARPGTTAKVGKNISITLNNTANKGIATVFNGGKYFLTSGATIAESEITVNDPESLASGKTAIIAVDPTEKTIKVTYPADETTLSSGWYRIHMVDSYTANRGTPTTTQSNVCSGLGDNTYLINADAEFWQTATNSYALKYGAKPSDDKEATAFIYVDVNSDASQWMFTSSNGHVVAENCTSYRTGSGTLGDGSYSPALDKQRNAVYRIGNWSTYGEYVGKSSSHASHFQFEPISTDAYDIYTVSITSNNTAEANASNIAQDSYLFFKSSKNKGAATAYNGGKFFVTKGTEITSDDLQFMACSSDYLVPSCTIDANNKKITVDFTSDQSGVTAFNLTEGWYSFSLTGQVSYGSTITETNRRLFNNWIADAVSTDKEYMLASDTHYSNYHVVMGGKPAEEKAAMAFFYVVPASNGSSIQIRSIDGYWMADNAQAATSAGSASITANSVQKGVYSFNFGPYYNHTFSAPLHPVGKYGNVNFAWKLTPADMTNYDVIQVTLKKGDSAVNGVKIGLSTAEASTVQLAPAMRRAASTDEITNYGLQEVYNGGYFIVNKGANVTADNLSITAYDGNSTPAISTVIDTNGNVTGFTVDYGDTATGITDLDAEPQGEAVIYDLQGRRVKNPTHGIYIINGRKTLLR